MVQERDSGNRVNPSPHPGPSYRGTRGVSALKLKKQKLIDLVASEVLSPEDFKDQIEQVGTALKDLENQLLPAVTSEKELAHFIQFAEWMGTDSNKVGVPRGIRTLVTAVKGRCPRPTRRWGLLGRT